MVHRLPDSITGHGQTELPGRAGAAKRGVAPGSASPPGATPRLAAPARPGNSVCPWRLIDSGS